MQADIPLPQASTLFMWAEGTLKHGYVAEIPEPAPVDSEEPTNIVQSRKSEFTEEPGGQFSYEPREAVWRALEAKLKRYFPGKEVEFDPTETCDGLWGLTFWIRTPSGSMDHMIVIDPEVDCDDTEFKTAVLPSSTPEQREAMKTKLDTTITLFIKKFIPPRPGEEDELQDDEEPSEEVFGDILDMVMEVADQILENPMGGRRKKRKTKRRGKKRSTRKKLRRNL